MVGDLQSALEWGIHLKTDSASRPDIHLWSEASGLWGCGAIWQGQWLQVAWDHLPIASASIALKEFFPILAAGAIWGQQWRGLMVCTHCDNGAVVEIVNSGKAKDPLLAHQLRALFYLCAFFEFDISAVHTLGRQNGVADAIACNNTEAFPSKVLYASRKPSRVPVVGANTPRTRLPITTDIMRLLKWSWEARGIDFTTVMLWAVACTCFFGFLHIRGGNGAGGISVLSGRPPIDKRCFRQLPHQPDKDLCEDKGVENRPIPPRGYNMPQEDGARNVPCRGPSQLHCTEGPVARPTFSLRRWVAAHERSCHVHDKNNCRKCEWA